MPFFFKVKQCRKLISLCSKMYFVSDIIKEKIKFSCKGLQKDSNVNCQKKFKMHFLIEIKVKY